jgi:hypothetical protein
MRGRPILENYRLSPPRKNDQRRKPKLTCTLEPLCTIHAPANAVRSGVSKTGGFKGKLVERGILPILPKTQADPGISALYLGLSVPLCCTKVP